MPKLSDISPEFLLGMVTSMYHFEAKQVLSEDLLTDKEIGDFYATFMGNPL